MTNVQTGTGAAGGGVWTVLLATAAQALRRGLMLLVVMLFASSLPAQNLQVDKVEASIEPPSVFPGETVVYVVKITYRGNAGAGRAMPSPSRPQLDPAWGMTFQGGVITSSNFSMDSRRGTAVQSVEYRYPITVSREGEFQIPPVIVSFAGQRFESNPVTVTVSKSLQPPAGAAGGGTELPPELQGKVVPPRVPGNPELSKALNGGVFILPVVDGEAVYEGQQVKLAYHLVIDPEVLRRAGVADNRFSVENRETPELKQFLKDVLFDLPRTLDNLFQERVIGGKTYVVAPLYEAVITPTKTGELTVEPYKLSMLFRMRQQPGRRGGLGNPMDPFDDPFFNDLSPFFGGRAERVIAQSAPIELDVKPVPKEGRPADFAGAVGDFALSAQLDKRAAVANDDIVALTLQVEGEGDAAALSPPELPAVDGLVLLEKPESVTSLRKEGSRALSTKTFTYKLRPTKPGTLRIPPLSLSTFNPATEQYEVVQTEPLEVQAVASSKEPQVTEAAATAAAPPALVSGGGTPASQQGEGRGTAPPVEDLRYIHPGPMTIIYPGVLSGQGPLFVGAVMAPPLMLFAGWLLGRRRSAMESNAASYRAGRAGAAARRHLRKAGSLVGRGEPEAFYEELARALRGFFGARFQIEPSGLTVEEIEERLLERGASGETVAATRRLLDTADQVRYAPAKPGAAEQKQAYADAARLLNEVEKLR